jgi:hypothetical protein
MRNVLTFLDEWTRAWGKQLIAVCVLLELLADAGWSLPKESQTADLTIVVLDPSGSVVSGAAIDLHMNHASPQQFKTDREGKLTLTQLTSLHGRLRINADGFEENTIDPLKLKPGLNRLVVRLRIARHLEHVEIEPDKQEAMTDPRGNGFSNILTEEQIALLPDDPDEFEEVLQRMSGAGSGPNAPVIRVNGFRGGKLPPKSQIRQIRFRMNPYEAETHEAGFGRIDILTKPGVNSWHGMGNFGFQDEALNARNAFAPVRAPEQNRRLGLVLSGPVWKNRTSFFANVDASPSYDSKTIVAQLPDGLFSDAIKRPSRRLAGTVRIEHALTKSHSLRMEVQRNAGKQENLGVGDFDLPERAYSKDQVERIFRISETGMFRSKLINEFRFQVRNQATDSGSASSARAILVLGAFNIGGAQVQNSRRSRDYEVANNLDFVHGKHSFRAGLLLEAGQYRGDDLQNGNGTFTFASLTEFSLGRPTTFSQRTGATRVHFSQYQLGIFWQDDIRPRKNLTLSLGLRHEIQTHLRDHVNPAPRLGFAWSPFASGKTTLRAGAGIFYDWFSNSTYEQVLRVNGEQQKDLVIQAPDYPDPFAEISSTTPQPPVVLPPSRVQLHPDLRMPYVVQGSMGVQQQLPGNFMLMSNLMFQRGVHLLRGHNINAPIAGIGRPDPTVGNITQVESTAFSSFRSLQFHLMRFSRNYHLMANYTLGRSINETDGPMSLPADNYNLQGERGPSPYDVRHRLFAMWNFTLLKGIQLGTMFQASSAAPYNITTGFDDNGDSSSTDRPPGVGRNSSRGKGQWDVGSRLSKSWGFGKEQTGGTMDRVMAGGAPPSTPGQGGPPSPMMGITSNRRFQLEFYVQTFNLFNHVNLTNFTGVQTSPFYGQPTAAMPGRRMETGLRFSF